MLSSLGPSAFGYNPDSTAAWAGKVGAQPEWRPAEKFLRKGQGHQHAGGGDPIRYVGCYVLPGTSYNIGPLYLVSPQICKYPTNAAAAVDLPDILPRMPRV